MPHEYFCLSDCLYGSMRFFFICTAPVLYGYGSAVCDMRICEILINLFGLTNKGKKYAPSISTQAVNNVRKSLIWRRSCFEDHKKLDKI